MNVTHQRNTRSKWNTQKYEISLPIISQRSAYTHRLHRNNHKRNFFLLFCAHAFRCTRCCCVACVERVCARAEPHNSSAHFMCIGTSLRFFFVSVRRCALLLPYPCIETNRNDLCTRTYRCSHSARARAPLGNIPTKWPIDWADGKCAYREFSIENAVSFKDFQPKNKLCAHVK